MNERMSLLIGAPANVRSTHCNRVIGVAGEELVEVGNVPEQP